MQICGLTISDSLPKGDMVREFGAVGEHELDCCTCVTEGKPSWGVLFRSCGPCLSDMGRFEIFMGRFGFGHGAFCRRTGRLNPARSSLEMMWLNPARSSKSQFQETIVPRVSRVPHVTPRHQQSAKRKGFWEGQRPRCPRFAAARATRTLPLPCG